ncbi:MAG TPA: 50S ribosomal protein L25 [Anaerolineae bacterium]|nr:50S ribosomal protein L25 [Anaerolineae bacterium]HQH37999.1 50S ribosomal protein L25 [Anaerolineae bacterium]
MEVLELRATPRTVVGKKVKTLRRKDIVPGVIYGHTFEAIPVQFNSREVEKAISKAGTSSTVQVYVEGTPEPYLAIFRDVQHHTTKRNVIHLDLQALNLKETVRVPVSVVLTGKSPAVETFGGILLQVMNELEIEALPTDLVHAIHVDISAITAIGQSITVGDITPPPGVTIRNMPNEVVVQVTYAEAEEEKEELTAAPETVEVEVIRKRPVEEEEAQPAEK